MVRGFRPVPGSRQLFAPCACGCCWSADSDRLNGRYTIMKEEASYCTRVRHRSLMALLLLSVLAFAFATIRSSHRSRQSLHDLRSEQRHYFQSKWHPAADADGQCHIMQRYGAAGDGGKLICKDDIQESNSCLVVSVGSNGDFSFETSIHKDFPHCTIHVYDGTTAEDMPVPSFVTFFRKNIVSLSAFYQKIDILKVDCEGCELTALPFPMATQILVETHGCLQHEHATWRLLKAWLENMNRTHSIFAAEPNIEFGDGICIEHSYRKRMVSPAPSAARPLSHNPHDNATHGRMHSADRKSVV